MGWYFGDVSGCPCCAPCLNDSGNGCQDKFVEMVLISIRSKEVIVDLVDAAKAISEDVHRLVDGGSMFQACKDGCQFPSVNGIGEAFSLWVSGELSLGGGMVDACP